MKRVGSCGRFRARSRAARRRKRPGRSLSRRASDNGNYGNPARRRSGANPPARSGPDSLTVSAPPRSNPAPRSTADLRLQTADMQSGERKSAAECMFMHRLQSEGKAIRTSAARAPEPEVRGAGRPGSRAPNAKCAWAARRPCWRPARLSAPRRQSRGLTRIIPPALQSGPPRAPGARGSRGAPERNPARRRSAEGNAQGRAG